MSLEVALQRVALLQQARTDPAALLSGARAGGTAAPTAPSEVAGSAPEGSFASILEGETTRAQASGGESALVGSTTSAELTGTTDSAVEPAAYSPGSLTGTGVDRMSSLSGSSALSGSSTDAAGDPGARIVSIAESQVGQSEEPLGSNEGAAIAAYRSATQGAVAGAPWCGYFASWVAREAGEPLGANGEGLGSVAQIWSWAQSSGRAVTNGPGVEPQPGDLIVFGDQHVGIVKEVMANGDIRTVEGNYENKVSENVRTPTEATGYVDMQ